MPTPTLPHQLEALFTYHCARRSAISAHLPAIRRLAHGCDLAVEFGCKYGASTTALLLGAARVISYDLRSHPSMFELGRLGGPRWELRLQSSLEALPEPCDLLLLDSAHTYEQVRGELERHADSVRRLLVFHDTVTFGSIGADGETGRHRWTYTAGVSVPEEMLGIRPAIDELLIRDPTWRIVESASYGHGLLVLRRFTIAEVAELTTRVHLLAAREAQRIERILGGTVTPPPLAPPSAPPNRVIREGDGEPTP